ncbi:MAG: hypothetical protein HJJLKODD_00718 [Phycisphaerae bacterium]|nr:hypothetical protein [Phycisphaerae bacterium]
MESKLGLESLLALVVGCGLVAGGLIGFTSAVALFYVLTDGVLAAGIILIATLFGLWLVDLAAGVQIGSAKNEFARAEDRGSLNLPLGWQLLLGLGLGLGFLALAMLGLGMLGWLQRGPVIGLLLMMGLTGLGRLGWWVKATEPSQLDRVASKEMEQTSTRIEAAKAEQREVHQHDGLQWRELVRRAWILGLMPFLAWGLLGATVPPGLLWAEESRGYDVLEYHLQVPKEYYQTGRISYLPHNVYANFPMNAEMFYLLAMVVKDNAYEATMLAQLLNTMFAVMLVVAAWWWGRSLHRWGGAVAGLLAGSWPWLVYLSGIAYVENAMLLFGLLALLCWLQYESTGRSSGCYPWRWMLLSGLLAGLSGGCKYTAVIMTIGGIGGALLVRVMLSRGRSWKALLVYGFGAAVTLAPWLAKNYAYTGNPVFPLGYGILGADPQVWSAEQSAQWGKAHQVSDGDRSWRKRLDRLQERVLLDPRMAAVMGLLVVTRLFSRKRERADELLLLMWLGQVVVWLTATHLYARFAVSLLLPMLLLAVRSLVFEPRRMVQWTLVGLMVLIWAANLRTAYRLYQDEIVPVRSIMGVTNYALIDPEASNPWAFVWQFIPPQERLLMIAEARAFYMPHNVDYFVTFNRQPLARIIRETTNDEEIIRWLNQQHYRHLLVNWDEMDRLRRTYGLEPEFTRELFHRLENEHLALIHHFTYSSGAIFATLYEVRNYE